MSEFKREDRYIVLKLNRLPKDEVEYLRDCHPKAMVECVVVEHDWPECQLVWAMIEHRMAGKPVPNFNDWRRADELQQRLTAADERVDVLEGLLLQTNELLYAIQGDPGAVPSSTIDAMRGEVFTALKPADGSKPSTCTWSEGGFSWHTGCGKEWQFTDGGLPAENGMHFCHSCGKTLVVESAESA